VEERAARAAVTLRNFHAHHAKAEHLFDERRRHPGVFVHLAHQRPHFLVGKFIHTVAENSLVFRQPRQGRDGRQGLAHTNVNVIIAR
jgi:hypothetical protein